jgi:hypothetical protein
MARIYGEIDTEDELLCEDEETTCCEEDALFPPEPDEEEKEESRPFSYVRFRVPPLICCVDLALPEVKVTFRSPSALSLRISQSRRLPSRS